MNTPEPDQARFLGPAPFGDAVWGGLLGLDRVVRLTAMAALLFAGVLPAYMGSGLVVLLLGSGLLAAWYGLVGKSRAPLAQINLQAVAVLALLAASLGISDLADQAAPAGFLNLLMLCSVGSLLTTLAFLVTARLHLSRKLQLIPLPVVCGLMAGIVWLLLDAALHVAVGARVSAELPTYLFELQFAPQLLATLVCGVVLVLFTRRFRAPWSLPLASLVIVLAFHALANWQGLERSALESGGWLFPPSASGPYVPFRLADLSWLEPGLLLEALPYLLVMVLFLLLSTSATLNALDAHGQSQISRSGEYGWLGLGNLGCAVLGCPPGSIYEASPEFLALRPRPGRLLALVAAAVCLAAAPLAVGWLDWLPRPLLAGVVLLLTWNLVFRWLYERLQAFQPLELLVVVLIFCTVVLAGLLTGLMAALVLALLQYAQRYGMLGALHSRHSLAEQRSSVERSLGVNELLDRHGDSASIYTLRGLLFFGTVPTVHETLHRDLAANPNARMVLFDFKRVTGLDASALSTFAQIKRRCDSVGVRVLYSGVPMEMQLQLRTLDAVSLLNDSPLFFEELDFALEFMEEELLKAQGVDSGNQSIRALLAELLKSPSKINLVMHAFERVECAAGETLFAQGDEDSGFYILESGALSAFVATPGGTRHRIKKFGPGSLIGEMSMFTPERQRTASVVADRDSVLYFMSSVIIHSLDWQESRLAGAIHELIACTLGMRVGYMNRRLLLELE